MIVCRWCKRRVRQCSPHCTMGGWVHADAERHLCDRNWATLLKAGMRVPVGMWARPERLTIEA